MGAPAASFEFPLLPFFAPVPRRWLRIGAILVAALASAGLGFTFDQALARPAPLSLSLREKGGQLHIGWSLKAATHGARLEILDGRQQTNVLVLAPLADVTYAPHSGDVEVRLSSFGEDRTEIARFLVREPTARELKTQFSAALAEARALQAVIERQDRRVSRLERAARGLKTQVENPPARRVARRRARRAAPRIASRPRPRREMSWWR